MRAVRARGVLAAAAAAAAVLASAPAAGASVSRVLAYRSQVSGPTGWTCSYSNPEYMIHSGGATLTTRPGKATFTVTSARPGLWSDPYVTAGYDVDLNSELCNSRVLPGGGPVHGRRHGLSYALPVRLGRTGAIATSVHDVTSRDFQGDTGFDIWFEPSTSVRTYDAMANQGAAATEIMIWLSHPGLGPESGDPGYYPVIIDGRRWMVTVDLAAAGHGKTVAHPHGWNRVNFIAPQVAEGNVTVRDLSLNPFFGYAAAHGWLRRGDYLMAIDQGAELTHGTMRVAGYTLTGVR
jgi:Glycosyl hydrolase family 12